MMLNFMFCNGVQLNAVLASDNGVALCSIIALSISKHTLEALLLT